MDSPSGKLVYEDKAEPIPQINPLLLGCSLRVAIIWILFL